MNDLDNIEKALAMLRDRGAERQLFESLLTDISNSLADILVQMDKPKGPVDSLLTEISNSLADLVSVIEKAKGADDIATAISKLSIKAPDVYVSPTPIEIHTPKQDPPVVNVNTQDWTSLSIQVKPPSYDGTKNFVITKVK